MIEGIIIICVFWFIILAAANILENLVTFVRFCRHIGFGDCTMVEAILIFRLIVFPWNEGERLSVLRALDEAKIRALRNYLEKRKSQGADPGLLEERNEQPPEPASPKLYDWDEIWDERLARSLEPSPPRKSPKP